MKSFLRDSIGGRAWHSPRSKGEGMKEVSSGPASPARGRPREPLHQRYRQGQTPVGRLDERALGGVRANQNWWLRGGICLAGRAVKLGGDTGYRGDGARRGLRHDAGGAGKWEGKGESGCRRKSSRGRARRYIRTQ